MQHILRPYATAGIAIVGASLVAVTPVVAPSPGFPALADVALVADSSPLGDLLAPWIDAYNQAAGSVSNLLNSYYAAPNIGFQEAVDRLSGYLQNIFNDPSTIPAMTNAIQTDFKNAWSSMTLMDASQATINDVIRHTMDSAYTVGNLSGGHEILFNQIPGFLPADQADTITPIINFLGSPMSAVMLGMISPFIAPGVALGDSLQDAFTNMQNGDWSAAFQDFMNIPAAMFNASLNGATLNLDSLLPLINGAGLLPAPLEVTHLDFAFGGWLSMGGHVTAGPMTITSDGTVSGTVLGEVPAIGGSLFNSIGINLNTGVALSPTIDAPSDAIGPIGALLGLSQVIGSQLGWGTWDGKDPAFYIPVLNPGTGVDLPTIPTDFFDDGGAPSAAADSFNFGDLLQDLFGGL